MFSLTADAEISKSCDSEQHAHFKLKIDPRKPSFMSLDTCCSECYSVEMDVDMLSLVPLPWRGLTVVTLILQMTCFVKFETLGALVSAIILCMPLVG